MKVKKNVLKHESTFFFDKLWITQFKSNNNKQIINSLSLTFSLYKMKMINNIIKSSTYNFMPKILIQADESVSLVGFVVFSESFLKSALVVFIFLGLRIEFL